MTISAGTIITWVIIGLLGGTAASAIIKQNRRGYGIVKNLLIGLAGAFIGGMLFNLLNISIAPGVVISLDDVIAALVGSLVFMLVLRAYRLAQGRGRRASA